MLAAGIASLATHVVTSIYFTQVGSALPANNSDVSQEVLTTEDLNDSDEEEGGVSTASPEQSLLMRQVRTNIFPIAQALYDGKYDDVPFVLTLAHACKISYDPNPTKKLAAAWSEYKDEFKLTVYKKLIGHAGSEHAEEHSGNFVFFRPSHKTMVIVFKGTQTKADWREDFNFNLHKAREGFGEHEAGKLGKFFSAGSENCRLHRGFQKAVLSCQESIFSIIDAMLRKANEKRRTEEQLSVRDIKFIVTGHSMGGALAAIFACALQGNYFYEGWNENNSISVFTFGAPSFCNMEAKTYIESRLNVYKNFIRFVNVLRVKAWLRPTEDFGDIGSGIPPHLPHLYSPKIKLITTAHCNPFGLTDPLARIMVCMNEHPMDRYHENLKKENGKRETEK